MQCGYVTYIQEFHNQRREAHLKLKEPREAFCVRASSELERGSHLENLIGFNLALCKLGSWGAHKTKLQRKY